MLHSYSKCCERASVNFKRVVYGGLWSVPGNTAPVCPSGLLLIQSAGHAYASPLQSQGPCCSLCSVTSLPFPGVCFPWGCRNSQETLGLTRSSYRSLGRAMGRVRRILSFPPGVRDPGLESHLAGDRPVVGLWSKEGRQRLIFISWNPEDGDFRKGIHLGHKTASSDSRTGVKRVLEGGLHKGTSCFILYIKQCYFELRFFGFWTCFIACFGHN